MSDRQQFLGANPTRLRVAELCAAEPISRAAIAERLGRPSGAISAPDTLFKHGALLAAGRARASARGGPPAELLKLNPKWRKALAEARRLHRPEPLEAGSELLLIPLAGTHDACRVVIDTGAADIAWGARLDGERIGLLLGMCPDPEGAGAIRATRLLEQVGVSPVRLRLRAPMAVDELKRWALTVVGDEPRELQAGSGS
jgi:hypothetical protein